MADNQNPWLGYPLDNHIIFLISNAALHRVVSEFRDLLSISVVYSDLFIAFGGITSLPKLRWGKGSEIFFWGGGWLTNAVLQRQLIKC